MFKDTFLRVHESWTLNLSEFWYLGVALESGFWALCARCWLLGQPWEGAATGRE